MNSTKPPPPASAGIYWTFEVSRKVSGRQGCRGDHGHWSAVAATEAEARVIVGAECPQPHRDITLVAGDLLRVAVDGVNIWQNWSLRGEPLLTSRQRSAAGAAALQRWQGARQ